jgi:Large eukaryotic DNA virus major capsid protein
VRILCNGNEIQEEKPANFLTKIYPFRYTTGNTNAEIPIYTWAITSSKTQPSGVINASRITNLQLEAKFYALPTNTHYVYDMTLYAETLNFLVIASGSGAPKYVL